MSPGAGSPGPAARRPGSPAPHSPGPEAQRLAGNPAPSPAPSPVPRAAAGNRARSPATATRIIAIRDGRHRPRPDHVVTEEPMEIRVGGPGLRPVPLTVTMRTPGHDFELAVGLLVAEGVVATGADVRTVRYCDVAPGEAQEYNVVTVSLRRPLDPSTLPRRTFGATASCGVCGTATLDDLARRCPPVSAGPVVPASVLLGLPRALRAGQRLFDRTGGLHAAGLFRADGTLLAVREDVGRHNALDKLVGHAALTGALPLAGHVVALSGRLGYELVQKAASAGISILVAVSAPSSLALSTAERLGLTTVGFVRPGRANVYSHPERVDLDG
ncbi:MAG: formate dehydrogenase accessory sulfurtransferase FdhD [Acidimicrobiales bacterium]